jgi:protein-S-isoprenylcysteine O-methyltransferase Ste14
MSAIRWRARAFLGLPALDDPAAMKQPRAVPWLAAPAAFVVALAVLVAIGVAMQKALNGRDNWQVNAPAIAGLTAILLLAPSSPTQPKARNALVAAIVGLAVVGGGFGVAVAGHEPGTTYSATAFLIVTVGALAGCVEFTALTHVDRWTVATRAGSTADAVGKADGGASGDAAVAADAPSADT